MKLIAVTAGKGGVGKSCVAAYAGAALAKAGRRVLLLELGAQARSLDTILHAPGALMTVQDIARGDCSAGEAMADVPGYGDLCLIPTSPVPCRAVAPGELLTLLDSLPADIDFVIADGVDPCSFPVKAAHMVLLVTTPELLSVRAAADTARLLENAGCGELRLVINKVPPQVVPMKGIEDFDDIIDMTGARLIGVIPQSQKLAYASNNTEPLGEDSLTPQIFGRIAARIMGENPPLLVC